MWRLAVGSDAPGHREEPGGVIMPIRTDRRAPGLGHRSRLGECLAARAAAELIRRHRLSVGPVPCPARSLRGGYDPRVARMARVSGSAVASRGLPTADNAIILHAGVHKTGSTALQAALAAARPDLRQLGILYPGREFPAHHAAAWAVAGRTFGFGEEADRPRRWSWWRLAGASRLHRGRVVISSEFFGRMRPDTLERVVSGLGRERVHVVIAVRPLSGLLAASWQQYLKSGLTANYGEWLQDVLSRRRSKTTPGFWSRADFRLVVRRWLKVVPPDRFTAVVLDPRQPDLLFGTMEDLLDLPTGWLSAYGDEKARNRSLTAVEAELIRQVNVTVGGTMGWSEYRERIRGGAVQALVEGRIPPSDEPGISTPQWALDIAARRQRKDFRALCRAGIDLRGSPGALCAPVAAPGPELPPGPASCLPVDLAALAVAAAAGFGAKGRREP